MASSAVFSASAGGTRTAVRGSGAPCLRSSATAGVSPNRAAKERAVSPVSFFGFALAPLASRYSMTAGAPGS